MSDSRRAKRIASLIQSELSRALIEDVADPALNQLVIQDVDLSPDLKNAKIFYAFRGESPVDKELRKGFRRISPYFKKRLSSNLGLRIVPELHFEKDIHADSVARVFSLLNDVKDDVKHEDSP